MAITIVSKRKITGKGPGRPDYSMDIWVQPIPQIRGPIYVDTQVFEFTLPAKGEWKKSIKFDSARFIYSVVASVSANVLIELYLESEGITVGWNRGYQKVELSYRSSIPVDEIDITVKNLSTIDISGSLSIYSVKGVEEIAVVQW